MILFKYMPKTRMEFWDNLLLRFTQPSAFNDPYDCMVSHSWLPEKLMPGNSGFQDPAALFFDIEESSSKFNDNCGILCLSEDVKSILMWSHYSENHSGYVIGFDATHPFFALNQKPGTNQVKYCPMRPQSFQGELYEELYTKFDVWSYEKEWRLSRQVSKADETVRNKEELIHLFRLPPESIHSVHFGIRTPESIKENIIAKADQLNLSISFMQMIRHYETYALSEIPYEDYLEMQINRNALIASFSSADTYRIAVDKKSNTLDLVKNSLVKLAQIIEKITAISEINIKDKITYIELNNYKEKIKNYPNILRKVNCLPLSIEQCDSSITKEVFENRIHYIQTEVDNTVFHLIYIIRFIVEAVNNKFVYEKDEFYCIVNEKLSSAISSFASAIGWAALILQDSEFNEIIHYITFSDEFLGIGTNEDGWKKARKISALWYGKKCDNVKLLYQMRRERLANSRKQWILSEMVKILPIDSKNTIIQIESYIERYCPLTDCIDRNFLLNITECTDNLSSTIIKRIRELSLVFDITQRNGGFIFSSFTKSGNERKIEKIRNELINCGMESQYADEYCKLLYKK